MTTPMRPSSSVVAEVNAAAMDRYQEMRAALLNAPGVDKALCEIVLSAQLAILGHEQPFKVHARRALELNVSKQQIEQLILAGVGVTCLVYQAARAIVWLDEVHQQFKLAVAR